MTAEYVIGPVCTRASYEERIHAFFALSGATISQNGPNGRWYFRLRGGDGDGDVGHRTQLAAMKAALYAMGVDIASDRWTHETKSFELAGEQRAVR